MALLFLCHSAANCFGCAAGCLDLLFGCGAERGNLDGELSVEIRIADDLDAIADLADSTLLEQCLLIYDCTVLKSLECLDVNRYDIFGVIAGEASFGESSVKGHLAAFEAGPGSSAPGFLSLMSVTCSLAVA